MGISNSPSRRLGGLTALACLRVSRSIGRRKLDELRVDRLVVTPQASNPTKIGETVEELVEELAAIVTS